AINLDVRKGTFDLEGDFDAGQEKGAPRFTLANGVGEIADLETAVRGERDPFWSASKAGLEGLAIDLGKRSVTIDQASVDQATVHVVRQSNGSVTFDRLMRTEEATAAKQHPHAEQAAPAADAWTLLVRKASVERIAG